MSFRFVPNPDFAREIDRQVEYRTGKVRVAEEVKKTAQTIAPKRTGAYIRGLKVKVVGPAVYVTATDFKGHWIEWGTEDTPTFAPIRRAVLMSGLKLRSLPRGNG
jgi:hypothetical protein